MRRFIPTISASLFLTAILASGVNAQTVIGEDEFQNHCAACHGSDGKGNGPIIDFLRAMPADLTAISARNNGTFPFQAVYDTIADVNQTRGHGNSDMPIWGDRYNREVIAQKGEFATDGPAIPETEARILSLVFYLANIQQ